MDRSWAYRPPMHIGDRVQWTVSDSLKTSSRGPLNASYSYFVNNRNRAAEEKDALKFGSNPDVRRYRGTVWWLGRLVELGTGWSAGVEFDDSVPGGGDGTWFSRHLFSCPEGHGRFLPVQQLRKIPRLLVWPTPVTATDTPVAPARSKQKLTLSQPLQKSETIDQVCVTSPTNHQLATQRHEINAVTASSFLASSVVSSSSTSSALACSSTSRYQLSQSRSNTSLFGEFPSNANSASSAGICCGTNQTNLYRSVSRTAILTHPERIERPHSALPTVNLTRIEDVNDDSWNSRSNTGRRPSQSSKFSLDKPGPRTSYLPSTFRKSGTILESVRETPLSPLPNGRRLDQNLPSRGSPCYHGKSAARPSSLDLSSYYDPDTERKSVSASSDLPATKCCSSTSCQTDFVYGLYSNNTLPIATPVTPSTLSPAGGIFPPVSLAGSTYTPVFFGLPQGTTTTYAPVFFTLPQAGATYAPLVLNWQQAEPRPFTPTLFGVVPSTQSSTSDTSSVISSPSSADSLFFSQNHRSVPQQPCSYSRSIGTTTDDSGVSENSQDLSPNIQTKLIGNRVSLKKTGVEKEPGAAQPAHLPHQKSTSLEAESSHLSKSSTLDISRLLKKLEAAIARGDHSEAGLLARELASLKVSCSVTHAHGGDSQEQNGVSASDQNGDDPIQERNRRKKPEAAGKQLASGERMVETAIKTKILSDGSEISDEPPVINLELTKEQITSTTVHLAVQPLHSQHNALNSGTEETVHRRENKSILNRREVKSDNVSKLIESSTSVSTMPSIIENFNVQMYVEDRASHQGPIDVSVNASMTVGELRSKVYAEFGFPPEVQRWILGRRLADDDRQTLAQHRVTTDGCPVFLYLVAPRSSSRRDSRPLVGRRNSETLQGLPSRPKAMPPRQLSADGASSNAGPRLVSPAITKPGYDRAVAVVRPDTELLARPKTTNAEDPIKGNELIRQQEELDMEGDRQLHKILQSKPIPGNVATKPQSPFTSSVQTAGRATHSSNVSLTRAGDSSKLLPPTMAANQAANLENSAAVQKSTTKFAGLFSNSLAEGNRGSEQHHGRDRRGEEGKIIIKLTEQDPSSNLRVSVSQSPQTKRKTEQISAHDLKQLLPSQQDNLPHQLAQELQSEAVKQQQEHQKQIPAQQQGNLGRRQAQLLQQENQHQKQLSQPRRVETDKQQPHEQTKQLSQQRQGKLIVQTPLQQLPQRQVSIEQSNATPKHGQAQTQPMHPTRLNSDLQVQSITTKAKSPVSVRKLTAVQQPVGKGPSKNEKQVLQEPMTSWPKVEQDDKQLLGMSMRHQSPLVARKPLQPTSASNDKTSPGQRLVPGFVVPTPTKPAGVGDGWSCPRCTLVNPIQRPGCEACATERPSQVETSPATAGQGQQSHLSRAVTALETEGAVSSRERFECRVCFTDVPPGRGVVLRDCLHTFCRECLANAVRYSDTAQVKCPYRDDQYSCDASLQEREVKELVSAAEYEKHLNKSVKQAAGSMQNVFHCKTPDCRGFCIYEDNVNIYLCTVCYKQNCLTCQAQHAGQSCRQYQEMVSQLQDIASVKTQKFFEDMIRRGDGMPCPHCSVMLVRKWGCDWMRCPMCRTEICWVTRGLRWGPKGTGDTSGGCQCGIKGRKCHPKCTYCH